MQSSAIQPRAFVKKLSNFDLVILLRIPYQKRSPQPYVYSRAKSFERHSLPFAFFSFLIRDTLAGLVLAGDREGVRAGVPGADMAEGGGEAETLKADGVEVVLTEARRSVGSIDIRWSCTDLSVLPTSLSQWYTASSVVLVMPKAILFVAKVLLGVTTLELVISEAASSEAKGRALEASAAKSAVAR